MDVREMQLHTVRTVLQNEVNEIKVCVDAKGLDGTFYTVISITSGEVRRKLVPMVSGEGLFSKNKAFLGFYTKVEVLHLVFLYEQEQLLSAGEILYGDSFPKCRALGERLVIRLAESQLTGSVGLLLLEDRNLNLTSEGDITFNYFLDFAQWDPDRGDKDYYDAVAKRTFQIISRRYAEKYDCNVPSYPSELQVFYKKMDLKTFHSFNSLLTFLRSIPEEPTQPRPKVLRLGKGLMVRVKRKPLGILILLLAAATMVYAGVRLGLGAYESRSNTKNTTYAGMETIGDVPLGKI